MTDSILSEAPPTPPGPSLLGRAIAIFVRPGRAWDGLESRVQWWFPLLVILAVNAAGIVLLHDRALMPMLTESWDRQVSEGQMSSEQVQHIEDFMDSGAGRAITAAQQLVVFALVNFVTALVVWFGVSFLLGAKLRYRLALEVVCWSSLVGVPAQLLTFALAWFKESFRGVHVGFAVFLPEMDPPGKLMTGLGVVLDAIGPFGIWFVAVGVIGATVLSGAPRRSVAWVMASLYLVVSIFGAALAAFFTPGT
jgi:hypothetical protein